MRKILGLLLLLPLYLLAQTESRNGISFERELSSRSALALEVEYRSLLESFDNGRLLFLLAGNRELGERLSITPAIRLETSDGSGPVELRLQCDLNYKLPLGEGPFTFTGRLRWQRENELTQEAERPQTALRPRLGLELEVLKRWTIFGEYEPRYRLDDRKEWSRLRYTAGLEYELSDRISLEAFYRIEDSINRGPLERETQIGFYVAYQLPSLGKKDWKERRPFGRDLLN